jgi:serine/threonine-protein kinase RsbW
LKNRGYATGTDKEVCGLQVKYSLYLPRDAMTVPVARRLCRGAMEELGLTRACLHDVALAVTEACANVIEHSSDSEDEYEVSVVIEESRCEIRVIDTGRGFDHHTLSDDLAAPSAERGRGISLMRALVDNVRFESKPQAGTVVHLVKTLELEEHSPLRNLPPRRVAAGQS